MLIGTAASRHAEDTKYFPDMVEYMDKCVGRVVKQIDDLVTRHGLACEIASPGFDGKQPVKFTARVAG